MIIKRRNQAIDSFFRGNMYRKSRKPRKIKYSQIGNLGDNDFISFIYKKFMNEYYLIFDLEKEELEKVLEYKNFRGMNVGYPYTKSIISNLTNITDQAKNIGEVNLIQEHNSKLYGFNTEYFGIIKLLKKFNIELSNKNITILTDNKPISTIEYVLKSFKIYNYEIADINKIQEINSDILINNVDFEKIDKKSLNFNINVKEIIDLNTNPIFSYLYMKTKFEDTKVYNGLYKILYQEKKSIEILTKQRYSDEVFEDILDEFIKLKLNIVLIGMPGAGKTTIGRKISKILNKEHIDLDREFYFEYGISSSQYLRYESEESFRKKEAIVVKRLGELTDKVISTSGGVVTLIENYEHLKRNSIIFRIDRDLDKLSTRNRPLSMGGIDTLIKMKEAREEKYNYFTDYTVENRGDFDRTAITISDKFNNLVKNMIKLNNSIKMLR